MSIQSLLIPMVMVHLLPKDRLLLPLVMRGPAVWVQYQLRAMQQAVLA